MQARPVPTPENAEDRKRKAEKRWKRENYILERYGSKDPEYKKAHENVLLTFKHLDALGVPFWVQNSVVCFAENWRQYKNNYMDSWLLKHRNIDIKVS